MDYGSLLQRAWQLTWRYRFLWVLGLFVPGPSASCSGNFGGNGLSEVVPSNDVEDLSPGIERTAERFGQWVVDNIGLIVALTGLLVLIALALLVVSFVAQGGMARATALLAQGQMIALGEAWRAGLTFFWRYVGLWLLQIGLSLAAILVVALPIGLVVVLSAGLGEGARVLLLLLAVLLGLALVLAAIVFFIGLSIAVALAQRAIVVEDVGPVSSLRTGAALIRTQPGHAVLVWLISAAIGIGAAIILAIAILIVLVPLGLIGVALYSSLGLSPAFVGYSVVAILLIIVAAWLASAVIATYTWNYWTLAYLNFTGRLTDQLEPLPAGP